jgi:hypothetical protein
MIGLSADGGDTFKKRASIPLAPCILVVQIHTRLNVTCSFYRQGVEVVISKWDLPTVRLPTLDFVDKLNLLRQALNQLNLPFCDKRHVEYNLAGLLLRGEANIR